MKSKTLVFITASIITAAVMILTAGLSLLNGSAINESALPEESFVPITSDSVIGNENEPVVPEVKPDYLPETIPGVAPEIDYDPNPETDTEPKPELDYKPEPNPEKYPYVGGADIVGRGVVIDIYEQHTGKLVGQVILDSEPINYYICDLFDQNFDPDDVLYDKANPDDTSAYLPESTYRIEVYSGVWFAYSYGVENNSRWEFTQTGLTCEGGSAFIEYIDSLIANEIAAIENGTADIPETAMSVALRLEDSYWPKCERFTPRFPYIAE